MLHYMLKCCIYIAKLVDNVAWYFRWHVCVYILYMLRTCCVHCVYVVMYNSCKWTLKCDAPFLDANSVN
jgi:hypothetical protein